MKNNFIFLFIVLLFSCDRIEENNSDNKSWQDSVGYYYLESKNKNRSLLDRLIHINKAYNLSNNGEISYHKNWIHFSLRQYDSLKKFHKILVSKSIEIKDYDMARQYYLMGYYYEVIAKKSDSAFIYYNTSKNLFNKAEDSIWVGKTLTNMAALQKNNNDFFGSKETLTEALEFVTAKNERVSIAAAFNILATNHRKLLNFKDSEIYYKKAIDVTTSKQYRLIYKNNLAASYIEQTKFDKAISILNIIVLDSLIEKNQIEYARVLDNLVYAKWLSGLNVADKYFQEPLRIRKRSNDYRGIIASYTHLGEFYSETNPKKATAYFDSVIHLSKSIKVPRAEKDALKFLMNLQPNNVKIRDRYVLLQDSLYAQELKVKTQFAKYKYDDKLKQEDILRLEKENAKKELEASEQRNQKILYLGGLIFIASVLGLLIFGFRQRTKRLKQKSKTDKLEAVLETEAELSRKLHDDHGGKLNQAMLLVERDADKTVILDKLDSVYKQTRDFSREINSVATGPNYWEELKATLEYSKPVEVELIFNGAKELDWSVVGHQTKTILFKVLNELVINMARHSKASQTVILFKEEKKNIVIYYEDNGVGASKESLLRKNGLQNTEKRIQAIEGSITFDSAEGKGFRAEIQIPK